MIVYMMLLLNNQLHIMKYNESYFMRVVKVLVHAQHVLLLHGHMGIHWNLPFISVMFSGAIYQKQYVQYLFV